MSFIRPWTLGLVLLLGTAAWAQDTANDAETATPEEAVETPEATEKTPAQEAAPEPEPGTETEETADGAAPAEGDAAAEGPVEGQPYIAERFTDWVLSCVYTGSGNDPCRFIQVLNNGEGGRVAQVSIVPLPPGRGVAAAAVIETPLGTLLRVPRNADELNQPGGLRIQVDDGELRVFQFTFCTEGGCVAEIGMDEALVSAFKRGNVAKILIWSVDAPDQPVQLSLSLSGFTAGFNRVASLSGTDQ